MTHELISHYFKGVLSNLPLHFFREVVKGYSSVNLATASYSAQTFRNYTLLLCRFSEHWQIISL